MAEAMTGDTCMLNKDVDDENWMSTNKTICQQNRPCRAEMITDDACIMKDDTDVEGLTRTQLHKLC